MATLVIMHISDLHFGAHLFSQPDASGGGQDTHDPTLARGVALAALRWPNRLVGKAKISRPLRWVVSGDLTATGTDVELAAAHTFLHGSSFRTRPPRPHEDPLAHGDRLGLQLPLEDALIVSGNHDQWHGVVPRKRNLAAAPGFNPVLRDTHFENGPQRQWVADGVALEIFGLDSSAGFGGQSNRWAAGRISDYDLDALRKELGESTLGHQEGHHAVRALVIHHCIDFAPSPLADLRKRYDPTLFPSGGALRDRLVWARPLEPQSRDRLLDVCFEHNVDLILNGHSHQAFKQTRSRADHQLHELRCGSTTQALPEPPRDPAAKAVWERAVRPSMLVHAIDQHEGCTRWRSWKLGWNGVEFVPQDLSPWAEYVIPRQLPN